MIADESALLAAILANPDDDAPRLVYADWLDDHGENARAEFIRGQVAGKMQTLRLMWLIPFESFFGCQPHQTGMVAEKGRAWAATVPAGRRVVFTRGLASEIWCPTAIFLAHAPALFASQPLTAVRLTDRQPEEAYAGFGWRNEGVENGPENVPPGLWPGWDIGIPNSENDVRLIHQSRADADKALSAACVSFGRAAAGLPPYPAARAAAAALSRLAPA